MRRRVVRLILAGALALSWAVAMPVSSAAQSTRTAKASSATSKKAKARPRVSKRTSRARAAAAARARRAAAARQLAEAKTPHFKMDAAGNLVPDVRAAAAIIYNPDTGAVVWESNAHDQRSIASLTKLMTVVTFLADDPIMDTRVTVTRADVRNASTTHIVAGDRLTYDDLLHLTLIASDNAAARVLARTSEGGTDAFVDRMNEMAVHLGLTSTHYADPSGLDPQNVSSAYDISHLIAFAASDDRIGSIMRLETYEVHTPKRSFWIHSTNKLLGTDVDVVGGKTGFIRKAGYCLATLLQVPQGQQLAVVVLGATNSAMRFWEARHLFEWAASHTPSFIGGVPSLAAAAATDDE